MIWGGDKIGGDKGWRDEAEMQEFFDLIMRHWNSVISALNSGEPFLPYLLEGDDGIARANDWAEGFARGMKLRTDGWTELFDDERHAGFLVPILALAHERDPDPTKDGRPAISYFAIAQDKPLDLLFSEYRYCRDR